MGNARPVNECIRIGSIFYEDTSDECSLSCAFYQVVGLRGKTLVELRPLQTEEYVDERCVKTDGEVQRFQMENTTGRECVRTVWDYRVWRRPLPGRFKKDAEPFTVRALAPSEEDGRNWLQGRGEDHWRYFREMGAGQEFFLAGYSGGCARVDLKKEGKLPSWAELP